MATQALARQVLRHLDNHELRLCRRLNRASRWRLVRTPFAVASRLGDGAFWYALMIALPLGYGPGAWPQSLHMGLVGLAGLLLYRGLKGHLGRERPCVAGRDIAPGARALDRYSFPSGHSLHAVAFSAVVLHYHPELAALLLPFAGLVLASRVVLGLHYPSDVLAGALIGQGLASLSFFLLA